MPLSETNKVQSQSIEDLIAQLDAPPAENNGTCQTEGNCERKMIKGKRTNNNNSTSNSTTFTKTNSFGQSSEPILHKNILMSKKYTKHMKSMKEKGAMKKGGAGGKHNWGKPGCELEEVYLDHNDPNYDSEEEENVVMVCCENNSEANAKSGRGGDNDENLDEGKLRKVLVQDDLDSEIKMIVLEYFHNGDTIEVVDSLKMFNFEKIKAQLISYLIQIALENNNTCKELMSRLLRDLNLELFDENDFVNGFDLLLKNLPDLTLDNPDAPEKTGTFIARAIADKVISRDYLERFFAAEQRGEKNLPDQSNEKIQKAIESARLLVNINDHLFQLSHIWGNKGGFLPVKELTDKINELILEYNDSADVDEAIRCLKELNVPHFYHEFVYESLDFAVQKGDDKTIELIINLLEKLCKAVIVTYDQLKMGFIRIIDLMPDISLDVPNANNIMDRILNKCSAKGFVSEDILELAPNRSRKRFVSEGDGGRIKESSH